MRRFRLFVSTLAGSIVLCALGPQGAQGDVYAWQDASGGVTFSDVPPPPGARVLETVKESRTRDVAPAAPAPPHEAGQDSEVRNLSERVRQLEREAELASAATASREPYEPYEPYEPPSPPALDVRCKGKWADCWWWRNQPFYGATSVYSPTYGAVIVPSFGFRGSRHFHGGHRFKRGGIPPAMTRPFSSLHPAPKSRLR